MGSPDRATVLAQWSGECEIQSTYLVTAATGNARPILGAEETYAVGWSSAGDARVRLPRPIYGTDGSIRFRAGIYLVNRETLAVRLERSVRARSGC